MKKILVSRTDKSQFPKGILEHKIDQINWKEFPYQPKVSFAIAYNNSAIFLNFLITEKEIRHENTTINSAVWEDSCVEFFIDFEDEKGYYNFEFNCIGTPLIGFGKNKTERSHLPEAIVSLMKIDSDLVKNTTGDYSWELTIEIPFPVFIHHKISGLRGEKAKSNFYKCGDLLVEPHFLSWNNIESASPNFHLTEYFGELKFE